jgi:hypothetical protein
MRLVDLILICCSVLWIGAVLLGSTGGGEEKHWSYLCPAADSEGCRECGARCDERSNQVTFWFLFCFVE